MTKRTANAEAEEWLELPLDQACGKPIVYGIVQAGPHVAGGVPYIRSTDVGQPLDASGLLRTTTEIAKRYRRSTVSAGDIVFSLRGNIGAMSIVPASLEGANLTQGTARISASEAVLGAFLFYALQTETVRRKLYSLAKGSALQEVTLNDLRAVSVLLPRSQALQFSIAEILGNWDRAIQMLESSIRQRALLRRGLMQQLLTGNRRFPGVRGGWQRVAIGDVLAEVDRPVEMRDEILYHLASVRRNWGGLFEREQLLGSNIKTKNLREIKTGDFLISHIQAAYGSLALVPPEFDGYKVSDLYTCLIPRDAAAFDIRFFGYLAQQVRMTYLCRISSNGFFAERLRLNFMPEVFLQQVISIPPTVEEQRRIIDVLETADRELALRERLLAAYRKQKKGLMQQLLTGKQRVRVSPTSRAAG